MNKKNLFYILGTVVAIALIFLLGGSMGSEMQEAKDLPVQVELQRKVDSLERVIQTVEINVNVFSREKDSLERELTKALNDYKLIERKYGEKIRNTVEYTLSDCQQFFSDNYPE